MIESLKHLRNLHNAIIFISVISIALVLFLFNIKSYDKPFAELNKFEADFASLVYKVNGVNNSFDSTNQEIKWQELTSKTLQGLSVNMPEKFRYEISTFDNEIILPDLFVESEKVDSTSIVNGTFLSIDTVIKYGILEGVPNNSVNSYNLYKILSPDSDLLQVLQFDSLKCKVTENKIRFKYSFSRNYTISINLYNNSIPVYYKIFPIDFSWRIRSISGFEQSNIQPFFYNLNNKRVEILTFSQVDSLLKDHIKKNYPFIYLYWENIKKNNLEEARTYFTQKQSDKREILFNGLALPPITALKFIPAALFLFLLYYLVSILHLFKIKKEKEILIHFPYIGLFIDNISKTICFITLSVLPAFMVFLSINSINNFDNNPDDKIGVFNFILTSVVFGIGARNYFLLNQLKGLKEEIAKANESLISIN